MQVELGIWGYMHGVCTCSCVYVCMCMCGGQKSMVGVFLNHSQAYFLRQSPSLILELTDSGRLANECQEPTCLLPTSFLGLYTHTVPGVSCKY